MSYSKLKESASRFIGTSRHVRWALLCAVTAVFLVILYPNLVSTRHTYHSGDIAERDIKAPIDFLVEDHEATERNRKQALEAILTVYDHNGAFVSEISHRIRDAFSQIRPLYDAESSKTAPMTESAAETVQAGASVSLEDRMLPAKGDFETRLGISVNAGAFRILVKEEFSEIIPNFITRICTEILENGVVNNKEILLREIDKGIILRNVDTKAETIVRNLKQYYGHDQAKTMVRVIGQPLLKDLNYTLINLIVDFCQRLINPNITLNRSETEERKKKAEAEIKPVLYKIKAGEMLLREGERVTDAQLLKLNALGAQANDKQIFAGSLGAAMIVLSLLILTYLIMAHRQERYVENKNLLFMATLIVALFFIVKISVSLAQALASNAAFSISPNSMIFGIPAASGAMIVCLFMGLEIAVPFAMVVSAGTTILLQNRFDVFIYFLLSSTMGAYWLQSCRERKVFIKAGVKLGLVNVVLAAAIGIYTGDLGGMKFLWDWLFAFQAGLVSGVITAGLAPMIELGFDYTTDIKLLELANLDRPILKRLMMEAPGTYHHSMIVGSMVEAAASEIGANPLQAKVCGYYHDIGKIKKPLYFIENQADYKNKHDKLAPSMSSLILIAHVKNGVEIAREHKLGQAIMDTIRQHHGTSLISYFYEKAKQMRGEDSVKIDDFRYPGPKPQTREAGLVMLADIVEAASRTLENPTPARVQGLVQNLINKAFSDGQLDDCELTLKDLHSIAKSFHKILNAIHHHRIEYFENPALSNGKVKDGGFDRQQAKQLSDIAEKGSGKGPRHLRRLGLS